MTRMNEFKEDQTIVITPLKSFPVIKDIVTDVSWNYEQNQQIKPFSPSEESKKKDFVMMQKDVERVQEFRKCIECYLCQNMCHVIRDNEGKEDFSGPRYMARLASLEMHPMDEADRIEDVKDKHGSGMCNITRCCTEVCPEEIQITDDAIIPLKERVVDRFYDPVMMVFNKIFSKKNIGITRIDKSDNAIKIINSLENNSARIISNQNMHDSSIEQLLKIFNKESYDLIFLRREVKQYNQSLKDLMYSRKLLNNILDEFNLKISDALLVSEESSYSSNIIDLSRKIELYNEQMNEFENYVRSLESIAGKECRGLVYLIKKEEKKDYKEKYLNDLSNYNFILKEIPKLLSSI